jgi:anti-sigma regulatory factor (Ser/Thr protein kinase)
MATATGLTIRVTVLLGFGFTVGVWLFAGYDAIWRIGALEVRAEGRCSPRSRSSWQSRSVRLTRLAGGHVLDDARSITDGAFATVRDLSSLLHPSLLDDLGLPAAVEWYVRGWGKRHGLHVDLCQDGMDTRLMPDIEVSAYRIVQEALTNVARHARAAACRINLQRLPNTVLITIEDDGDGFARAAVERAGDRSGLGLVAIQERVTQFVARSVWRALLVEALVSRLSCRHVLAQATWTRKGSRPIPVLIGRNLGERQQGQRPTAAGLTRPSPGAAPARTSASGRAAHFE